LSRESPGVSASRPRNTPVLFPSSEEAASSPRLEKDEAHRGPQGSRLRKSASHHEEKKLRPLLRFSARRPALACISFRCGAVFPVSPWRNFGSMSASRPEFRRHASKPATWRGACIRICIRSISDFKKIGLTRSTLPGGRFVYAAGRDRRLGDHLSERTVSSSTIAMLLVFRSRRLVFPYIGDAPDMPSRSCAGLAEQPRRKKFLAAGPCIRRNGRRQTLDHRHGARVTHRKTARRRCRGNSIRPRIAPYNTVLCRTMLDFRGPRCAGIARRLDDDAAA